MNAPSKQPEYVSVYVRCKLCGRRWLQVCDIIRTDPAHIECQNCGACESEVY